MSGKSMLTKTNTTSLTINGKTRSLSAWCALAGRNYQTAYQRLRAGWTPEDAIFGERSVVQITIGGRKETLQRWAELSGQSYSTIYQRLRAGWDPVDAVCGKARKFDPNRLAM